MLHLKYNVANAEAIKNDTKSTTKHSSILSLKIAAKIILKNVCKGRKKIIIKIYEKRTTKIKDFL